MADRKDERPEQVMRRLLPAALGWLIALSLGAILAKLAWNHMEDAAAGKPIVWKYPLARWLALGAVLIGWAGFHLRRQRSASFSYSRVDDLARTRTGLVDLFTGVPAALRMIGIAAIAFSLGRPQTFKVMTKSVDSIDIMLVFDLSKSMEESDLPRNRLDAAQRVVRNFIKSKELGDDRIGLVVFAQRTMLQCPLTTDKKLLDNVVANLQLGDIPEYGTAIGDGLGLALAELKRTDKRAAATATSGDVPETVGKVVILLSDGDSNVAEHFDPDEAARIASDMKIKVFTVLLGTENAGFLGGMGVNPATMHSIADTTGGEFFRADDQEKFEQSFKTVRNTLHKVKRTKVTVIPDKELYWPWMTIAAAALALEILLSLTRFRRFP